MPPARATFAKPRPRPEPAGAAPPDRLAALGPFANPALGAGTAAGFFVACAAALVSLTGDPKAGAPVVRISLARIADTTAPPGCREALPPETTGEAPCAATTVNLSTTPTPDETAPEANGGAAIITISGDSRLDGAQPLAAG